MKCSDLGFILWSQWESNPILIPISFALTAKWSWNRFGLPSFVDMAKRWFVYDKRMIAVRPCHNHHRNLGYFFHQIYKICLNNSVHQVAWWECWYLENKYKWIVLMFVCVCVCGCTVCCMLKSAASHANKNRYKAHKTPPTQRWTWGKMTSQTNRIKLNNKITRRNTHRMAWPM